MESLVSFEWMRDPTGYRLAWLPPGQKNAFWATALNGWSEERTIERSTKLEIRLWQQRREKAKPGFLRSQSL
jgi:hypothetical protein